MGGLSRAQAALAALAGIGVLVAGFLAGSAIGDNEDESSLGGQSPTRIATQRGSVDVPTLGEAKPIPTLAAQQQATEAAGEEEGGTPTFAPSSSPEEATPEETASPAPTPTPEPAPEVTVAPNG